MSIYDIPFTLLSSPPGDYKYPDGVSAGGKTSLATFAKDRPVVVHLYST